MMEVKMRGKIDDKTTPSGREAHLGTSLSALGKLKAAKLPPMSAGVLSMLGPAFVWASLAQGSGELIWWPYLAAKYGTVFLGLLVPSLLIQYFVNQEIVRYTALTGEGPWSAMGRIGRWFSVPFWFLAFVALLWFGGYASAGGTALRELFGRPIDPAFGSRFWGLVIIVLFFAGIVLCRVVYSLIEWFMKIIMIFSIVGVFFAILRPEVLGVLKTFFAAAFNPLAGVSAMLRPSSIPNWDPTDVDKIVTGIAYAGMGGYFNLLYAYWMRDKGAGMSRLIGRVTSPITARAEAVPGAGYFFVDTDENHRNWKNWLRYIRLDNGLAVTANGLTTLMMTLLGFAVLNPAGVAPSGWRIAVEQARFLESVWGSFGRVLFLCIGFAFLGDTWVGLADGLSRKYADFFFSNFNWAKKWSYRRWYYVWLFFLVAVTIITIFLAQPGPLILIAGVVNIFAFTIFIPAYMYMNYFKIPKVFPKWVRPSDLTMAVLGITWFIYLATAVWYVALAPKRIPYLVAAVVMWFFVGGYFYLRDRRNPLDKARGYHLH